MKSKTVLCSNFSSPPKPTRMVANVIQLPTERTHSVRSSPTLKQFTGLPTFNNVLPNRAQTLSTMANTNPQSQRAPSLALADICAMPNSKMLPVPAVQVPTRLPDGLLTPEAARLHSTSLCQQSSQNIPSVSDVPVKSENGPGLESLLVDRAIKDMMSLPDVVGEVAVKHREQIEELGKQQQQLATAMQQLKEEEKTYETVRVELQSVKRQTWLIDDKVADIQQQYRQLETDIEGVIHRTTKLTQQLELVQESLERDGELYLESVERMRRHVALVESLESSCVHHRALRLQRHTVEELRQQKQDLAANSEEHHQAVTSGCATRIQKESDTLKMEILRLDNKKKGSILQVHSEKDRQRQLKQDIQVLQKRNAAQLTRLRRQLKVSQCRNRQWGEQAAQLESTVSALKRQLEE